MLKVGPGQDDVGRLERHIRATAHRDAEVGGNQGRGVVDAVSDHGHRVPHGLHLFDQIVFVMRPKFTVDLIDPDFLADFFRDGGLIAGDNHGDQSHFPQTCDGRAPLGVGRRAERQLPAVLAVHGNLNGLGERPPATRFRCGGQRHAKTAKQPLAAYQHIVPFDDGLDPFAQNRLQRLGRRQFDPGCLGVRHDRRSQRMVALLFGPGGQT